jgi:hypothetical protein
VRGLFLAGLGAVYACAFVSLWVQIEGLIGSGGIAPIADTLDYYRDPSRGFRRFPTLLWLDHSDLALHVLCGAGVAASACIVAGVARLPCLVLAWACYLSLFAAGVVFTSFQWDVLLLECGFLAIFLAPARLLPGRARAVAPSMLALWAQRWLLFRLMFASGVVKLTSGDPSWADGTALSYHYETQPLPTWVGWYVHRLPGWALAASVYATLAIELAAPVLIFLGRRGRIAAFVAFTALQVGIGVAGNYGFFNLLTFVLSLTLLDDGLLPRRRDPQPVEPPRAYATWIRRVALGALLVLATAEFLAGVDWRPWSDGVERARRRAG